MSSPQDTHTHHVNMPVQTVQVVFCVFCLSVCVAAAVLAEPQPWPHSKAREALRMILALYLTH